MSMNISAQTFSKHFEEAFKARLENEIREAASIAVNKVLQETISSVNIMMTELTHRDRMEFVIHIKDVRSSSSEGQK